VTLSRGWSGVTAAYDTGMSLADEFHLYAVVWEPDRIRWYVDDEL